MPTPISVSSIPDALRAEIDGVLAGSRGAARSAGRFLARIPADTDPAALRAVEDLLAQAPPRFWIAVENARSLLWEDTPLGIRTAVFDAPAEGPTAWPELAETVPGQAVLALSRNGRVRRRTLRWLLASGSPVALPVLALRAADWAPQVRDLARRAVRAILEDDADGAALALVAPLALQLTGRRHGRWLADEIVPRLAGDRGAAALARLIRDADPRFRRLAFGIARDTGRLEFDAALEAALHDGDVVVRTMAAESSVRLATGLGTPEAWSAVRRLAASRSAPVRVEAVRALSRHGDLASARAALTDRHPLVRREARSHLLPLGVDVGLVCRELLETGGDAVTPGVVFGFVETTDTSRGAADGLLVPLLRHPRAGVRVAAVRALRNGPVGADGDTMLGLIEHDPARAVGKAALTVLRDRKPALDPARLLDLLRSPRPTQVRKMARVLLADLGDAWQVAVDVSLLADADAGLATAARDDLRTLLRRSLATRPDRGVPAELITAHLADADRLLSAEEARLLRFSCGLSFVRP